MYETTDDIDGSHWDTHENPILRFSSRCGPSMQMSRGETVATRVGFGYAGGIVFSSEPIAINHPVRVVITETDNTWSGSLRLGFTSINPDTYPEKLPNVLIPNFTELPGVWAETIHDRYNQKNAVIEYYVDSNGRVHYSVNDVTKGELMSGLNIRFNLWAVLDVYGGTMAISLEQRKQCDEDTNDIYSEIKKPTLLKREQSTANNPMYGKLYN